jgi:hypothetical protein
MALTESKIKDLKDKKFDKLFEKHRPVWTALVHATHAYSKENITGGRDPRPGDVEKVLYIGQGVAQMGASGYGFRRRGIRSGAVASGSRGR